MIQMMCKIFFVFPLRIFMFSSFFSRGCARSRRVVHETLFTCKEIRKTRCFRSEQKSWFFGVFGLRKTIEKVRSSFSAVWAARIPIKVPFFIARRGVEKCKQKSLIFWWFAFKCSLFKKKKKKKKRKSEEKNNWKSSEIVLGRMSS